MATTTNYSWTTPDDTALVKDGAAAIRSLGTAIDTTVFTNAGAAVAKATVDAKGDLIAGTADNTIARLAVGANDTVLTADSSTATGLKWATPAGSLSLVQIASGSWSGSSVTISGLAAYDKIIFQVSNIDTSANSTVRARINGSTTADQYKITSVKNPSNSYSIDSLSYMPFNNAQTLDAAVPSGAHTMVFDNCKAAGFTQCFAINGYYDSTGANRNETISGVYINAANVASIVFSPSSGTFAGDYVMWGG